jgi:hypothetical protein
MWIFSDIGFFSVVEADKEKLDRAPWFDGPVQAEPCVLVRARNRGHLEHNYLSICRGQWRWGTAQSTTLPAPTIPTAWL